MFQFAKWLVFFASSSKGPCQRTVICTNACYVGLFVSHSMYGESFEFFTMNTKLLSMLVLKVQQHKSYLKWGLTWWSQVQEFSALLFRWFKFTLKPPNRITGDKLRLAILTLPFGLFGSNLDTRDLETYPRTYSGHFWNMSIFDNFRAVWVLFRKWVVSEN